MNDRTSLFPGENRRKGAWNVEDEAFGKWFPRVGALALVIGAGFGYRYAIDQGWIGARLRVLTGLLLGSALLAAGEWARNKRWGGFASAVTGGGIALLYLTLWASTSLYGLIPASVAFFSLVGTSSLGVLLALRHRSQALALISVVGGFINPFVTGLATEIPTSLYLYTLAIDLSVVALGFFTSWRLLQHVAFASSWVVIEVGNGPLDVSLMGATGVFLMFGVVPYLRALTGREGGVDDLAFVPLNGLIYYLAVFPLLEGDLSGYRGPFTLAMAGIFIAAWLLLRIRDVGDDLLNSVTGVMSFTFLALWAPVQLGAELMALGWSVQAVILLGSYLVLKDEAMRWGGWVLLGLAGFTQVGLALVDPAAAVTANFGRFVFILTIVGLYLGTAIERRDLWSERPILSAVAASGMTLLWLSLEVYSWVSEQGTTIPAQADLQLGLSGVWSLYAGALLAAGILLRSRPVRLASATLFGVIVAKLTIHDLWLLDSLQRLIGFAGLGLLLLASSLAYNRFAGGRSMSQRGAA